MKSIEAQHGFLQKSATLLAVSVAGILVVGKYFAYTTTGSLTIQASLLDSCLDGFISILNFFAIRHALEPADPEHRFGHGKVEALAGLLQALIIVGSSLWMIKEVIQKIMHPEPLIYDGLVLRMMIGASILTLLLVLWQKHVIRKTHSIVIEADCLHYQTDLLVNLGVIISMLLTKYFEVYAVDYITAAILVLYILKSSYEIGKKSFDILMDRELSEHDLKMIQTIVKNVRGVKGFHDLRTRNAGQRIFIQMHVEISETLSLKEAHVIADEIELGIKNVLPNADIIIHQDLYEEYSAGA